MARTKHKISNSPLADMAAGNLDRAASEINGTIAALGNVESARSENARVILERALEQITIARGITIETFENDL